MLIKVWASVDSAFPNQGPYRLLDTVEMDALCSVGVGVKQNSNRAKQLPGKNATAVLGSADKCD